MGWLSALTYEECREALGAQSVGRVAVTTSDGPFVVPLNYAVINDAIYFRVGATSVVANHVDGRPVAFEVDQFDSHDRVGWSVLARGHGVPVAKGQESSWLRAIGRPEPWAERPGMRLFMLQWNELTGRRMDNRPPG